MAVAQSVERARRSWVRSLLWPPAPYWMGRCQHTVTGRDRSHGLPALPRVWQHVKFSDFSLGTRPRYSLVVDLDVKKPTNQTNKASNCIGLLVRNKNVQRGRKFQFGSRIQRARLNVPDTAIHYRIIVAPLS